MLAGQRLAHRDRHPPLVVDDVINSLFGAQTTVIRKPEDAQNMYVSVETGSVRYRPGIADGRTVTFDNADNEVDDVDHGFETGDGPLRFDFSGGTGPTGLSEDTDYFVNKVTDDAFSLAANLQDTLPKVGSPTVVEFTTDGSGTLVIEDIAEAPTADVLNGRSSLLLGAQVQPWVLSAMTVGTFEVVGASDIMTYWFV